MRKLIFTLTVLAAITCLSLTSNSNAVGDLVTPSASCKDCNSIEGTCLDIVFPFYGFCRAAGLDTRYCEKETMRMWRDCVTANGCVPTIN